MRLLVFILFVSAASANPGFDDLCAVLKTRHIFDSQRGGGAAPMEVSPSSFAALTGILLSAEKTLLFFSGTHPDYNRVLNPGDTLGNAHILRAGAESIEVEVDGKTFVVGIGQTVPFDAASAPGQVPAFTPSASSGATSFSGPPASLNEAVMRRMMEKREQELQQQSK